MKIDQKMLQNFREDFEDAVADLEKKYGIVIQLGHISFSDDYFDAKFTAKVGDDMEEIRRKEFEQNCRWYDLKPTDYNREFTKDGYKYRIIGIKPENKKYPILLFNLTTGQRIKASTTWVKLCLNM